MCQYNDLTKAQILTNKIETIINPEKETRCKAALTGVKFIWE